MRYFSISQTELTLDFLRFPGFGIAAASAERRSDLREVRLVDFIWKHLK